MKTPACLALTVIALAACRDATAPPSPLTPLAASVRASGERVPDHYIVVFRDGVTDAPGLARKLVAAHGGELHHTYQTVFGGFAAELPPAAVQQLRSHPAVAYVEPDQVMTIDVTQLNATWGLDRADQRALPLDTRYTYELTGAGVRVYIIDTGIRTTHQEFGGRAFGAFTAINDGNGTNDCNGHGTHVAGTVGGTTYGVAKQVALYAVRVLGCNGSGSTSGVIAGVDWVTANRVAPAVANMSLGGGASTALDQAVQNSIAAGVTYAIAAGNSNANACNGSPGRVPPALTIASTTSTDARSSFSNFGTCVDLFAPGSGITSAYAGSDVQTAVLSGTSMASPHVAGAAALILQSDPSSAPAAVAQVITSSATTGVVGNPGLGSPNRLLFVGAAGPPPPPPPPNAPPVAEFTWSCSGLTCTLDGRSSTDDTGIATYAWDLGKSPDPTASGAVVTVTYPHEGARIVVLTVTDLGGLTNSITKTIQVGSEPPPPPPPPTNQPPVARFTWSCAGTTCTLDASTSTDDTGITSYSWDLGKSPDPFASGTVVTTTYAHGGPRTVTLTVTDGGGLTNTVTQTFQVPDA
jgi:hypothetical protein